MITEIYQFKKGQTFPFGVNGADLRDLQKHGLARSFNLIGSGNLTYDTSGHRI